MIGRSRAASLKSMGCTTTYQCLIAGKPLIEYGIVVHRYSQLRPTLYPAWRHCPSYRLGPAGSGSLLLWAVAPMASWLQRLLHVRQPNGP
jgi:hypothetical protein